ncbi:hypothetical protein GCM10011273_30270 [Asticcacaulis endophyticus]|jgi:hypothetical protein|uniref:Uncharacterized protein n=1 Tax=Asticcacaulis endophyticus TaxID=1395890 RepID=A0A918UWX5_9CAUL|nr:hypothetical protein GCM10011273_30270 [Asticcacaulis endophyticus]
MCKGATFSPLNYLACAAYIQPVKQTGDLIMRSERLEQVSVFAMPVTLLIGFLMAVAAAL